MIIDKTNNNKYKNKLMIGELRSKSQEAIR